MKKGLVTRDRSENDGRSFLISLTPEGFMKVKEMIQNYSAKMETVVSFLDPDEKDILFTLLNKMNIA